MCIVFYYDVTRHHQQYVAPFQSNVLQKIVIIRILNCSFCLTKSERIITKKVNKTMKTNKTKRTTLLEKFYARIYCDDDVPLCLAQ